VAHARCALLLCCSHGGSDVTSSGSRCNRTAQQALTGANEQLLLSFSHHFDLVSINDPSMVRVANCQLSPTWRSLFSRIGCSPKGRRLGLMPIMGFNNVPSSQSQLHNSLFTIIQHLQKYKSSRMYKI